MSDPYEWYDEVSKMIDENARLQTGIRDLEATVDALRDVVQYLRSTTQPRRPPIWPDNVEYRIR